MLGSINLADKSFEEILSEAVELIPLYTDEWTNFNRSDPGMTIIENLSAFTLLQQEAINEVTDAVRRRLLAMLGYNASEHKAARVLLQAENNLSASLTAGEKLIAGDLCFETEQQVSLTPWGLKAVYTEHGGTFRDITYLLENNGKTSAAVFGAPVLDGAALYLLFDGLPPRDPGSQSPGELTLYIQITEKYERVPFDGSEPCFADVQWQIYTGEGWENLEFRDETRSFLLSGAVRLTLPSNAPAEYNETPESGFAVRCVLNEQCYDLPPVIRAVDVNLFETVQKDTKAKSFVFAGKKSVTLRHYLTGYGYFSVYCREESGGPYRAYKPFPGSGEGRYYVLKQLPGGGLRFDFDKSRFGFAPGRFPDGIRIVCFDDETVHNCRLDRVMGYEDQIIDLEQIEHVLREGFCLMAEEPGDLPGYRFVEPDLTDPEDLCYTVLTGEGRIKISEPGMLEGCRLYLCDCAVTAGAGGNIIPGNRFIPKPAPDFPRREAPPVFINPAAGYGGMSVETTEQLRLRLLKDMKRATVAVTPEDYEQLALNTPGFCIHKVKAVFDEEANTVKVTVKPYSGVERPALSPVHIRHLVSWLEKRRTITTRVELCQPVYVPVDVQATIYVKSYFENTRRDIEKYITQALDGVNGDVPFGASVSFHRLFRGIEELECVESVYELIISPRAWQHARLVGADIQLNDDALYHPGRLSLEIITQNGSVL